MGKHILIEKCGNISLETTSVQVTAQSRPLRVSWTSELITPKPWASKFDNEPENVFKKKLIIEKYIPCNFKSIESIEEELTNILATEISASIDAEILGSLIDLKNE
jgi:hypothetical protein